MIVLQHLPHGYDPFITFTPPQDSKAANEYARQSAHGTAREPARSLGPALAAGEWTAFAAYIVGPVLGAAAGALFYEFIRCQASTEREVKGCC